MRKCRQAEFQLLADGLEVLAEVFHAADKLDDLFILAVDQIVFLKLHVAIATPSKVFVKTFKAREEFVLLMALIFEYIMVERYLPSPRVSNEAERKVSIKNIRSDRLTNRSGGRMFVSDPRIEDRFRGQFRLCPVVDFVSFIVLFQTPSNARSASFVQVNEYEFFAVRQDHVGFVVQATMRYDCELQQLACRTLWRWFDVAAMSHPF